MKKQVGYLSYLLRLWRVNGDEDQSKTYNPVWRASLQDPQTGAVQGFASLDKLFDFLLEQTRPETDSDHIDHKGDK